jgi:hypothetical protein
MQLSHNRPVASARFDDPNLVSCAGPVPMVALAQHCGLGALADEHLTVPTDKGSNAGAKVSALVAGMVAGADSIDDTRLLRHGAMGTLFDCPYAPSTLGSFLRGFAFGHVRQLDAVASRLLGLVAGSGPGRWPTSRTHRGWCNRSRRRLGRARPRPCARWPHWPGSVTAPG